jgi:hypothetical protein
MQDAAASVLADQFAEVLERLPAGLDLDRLTLETQAIQRKRELVDGAALLCDDLSQDFLESSP